MENKITLKYVTKFENNEFSYSNKFNLLNVIDLKQLHDLFKSYKYITNIVVIEQTIDNETKILYRLINGEKKEFTINYLDNEIEYMPYDIIINSVFDINELVINIVNFTNVFNKDETYNVISEMINEYEEEKKVRKISLF